MYGHEVMDTSIVMISKHLTRPSSAPAPQCCWRQQPWRSSCRSVCHSPVSVISFVKAEVICRNACMHPHTIPGQEVSQKCACAGVFTLTPLQGKRAKTTSSGCSNFVKISGSCYLLLCYPLAPFVLMKYFSILDEYKYILVFYYSCSRNNLWGK